MSLPMSNNASCVSLGKLNCTTETATGRTGRSSWKAMLPCSSSSEHLGDPAEGLHSQSYHRPKSCKSFLECFLEVRYEGEGTYTAEI